MLARLKQWAARLKRDTAALWFACRDPRTPWPVKGLTFLIVAYALSPVDLIPDFIPVIGYLDELILLPMALWLVLRLLPARVLADARLRADEWIAGGHRIPRSVTGLAIVVVLWLLLLWLLWSIWTPA
jgi:uncharacterized membrane protein YkvA (DUF1232 family)